MVPPLTLCAYMKKGPNLRWSLIQCSGGDEGDRTPDLLTASQALSQLSYAPVRRSTIRELGRRCKENFGKTFAAAAADTDAGTGREAPRCPIRPAGRARRAAATPPPSSPAASGHLESSRPPFSFRGAGRHSLNGHPAGAGPVIGANRAPARPATPKPCRFTGPGREPPSMPQSAKSKPLVDDLRIP